jgi:hypothetical protein
MSNSQLLDRIQTEADLMSKIDAVLGSQLANVIALTHTRRQEVRDSRFLALVSFGFIILIVISLFIVFIEYGPPVSTVLTGMLFVWTTGAFIFGRRWLTRHRLFARELNMSLVPIMSAVLERTVVYANEPRGSAATMQVLAHSELMTSGAIEIVSDDTFRLPGNRPVTVHELQVIELVQRKHGTERRTTFTGTLVAIELERRITHKTFISTEGDRYGFGHQSFWSHVLSTTGVQPTELESNDFERDLHVATTDPVSARELLTPDFMIRLHTWWESDPKNIRISFIDNYCYVLLPDLRVKFSAATTATNHSALRRYALSMVQPLWRALTLVEAIPSRVGD